MVIVETDDLKKYFRQRGSYLKKQYTKAVDGVSLSIKEDDIFGLVGETGSGKTTIARILLGLEKPTSGSVKIYGSDIYDLKRKELRNMRTKIQMIFQDPYSALDPRFKIKQIIEEPLKLNNIDHNDTRVTDVMEDAGLKPAESFLARYPHQLSGGQRQRVLIARALVLEPKILIADEPASMLDVSLKAGVLNYLKRINKEQKRSILVISHDIALASYLSREIAVLYFGKIVEKGTREDIINTPLHPYTKLLIESVPELGKEIEDVAVPTGGLLYSGGHSGCSFYPRCQSAMDKCKTEEPTLKKVSSSHYVSCHLY